MRMVLHGLSNDVSHLVVAAIIDYLHGMQDATLHRLQSVGQVRHGTLQDDVTRIVEEPVLVHATQMVYLVIRGIVIIMGLVAIACSRCLFRFVVGCGISSLVVGKFLVGGLLVVVEHRIILDVRMLKIKGQANVMCAHAEMALRVFIDGLEAETAFERHRIEVGHLEMIEKDDSETEVYLPNTLVGAVFRIDFV